jgi:NADH dehydrogenase FAD-containing subunit
LKDSFKITLLQSGDHILSTYDAKISEYAEKKFERDKIEVITHARVTSVTHEYVEYKKAGLIHQLPYGLAMWSAGNTL